MSCLCTAHGRGLLPYAAFVNFRRTLDGLTADLTGPRYPLIHIRSRIRPYTFFAGGTWLAQSTITIMAISAGSTANTIIVFVARLSGPPRLEVDVYSRSRPTQDTPRNPGKTAASGSAAKTACASSSPTPGSPACADVLFFLTHKTPHCHSLGSRPLLPQEETQASSRLDDPGKHHPGSR